MSLFNVARAIDVETIAMRMPDYGTHSLSVTRKGHYVDDFSSVSCLLVVWPSKFLGEVQQRCLRFAPHEYTLSGVLLYIFKGSGVDGDGFIAQGTQGQAQNGV